MVIEKRYVTEDLWEVTTQKECIEHTEGSGYWEKDSVIGMLQHGLTVRTPFAYYRRKKSTQNVGV